MGLLEILSAWVKRGILPRKGYLLVVLFIYPYLVGYTADPDSAGSPGILFEMLAGYGGFADVQRDCYGKPVGKSIYSSTGIGASAEYRLTKVFTAGIRGGEDLVNLEDTDLPQYTGNEDERMVWYYNPYIGIESKYVAFNVGFVYFTEDTYNLTGNAGDDFLIFDGRLQPSWVIRVGNREKFHYSTQYLGSLPMMSGSGNFDMGFGFGSTASRNLTWAGVSGGPYQGMGLVVKQNLQLSESIDLLLRGRAGTNDKTFEGSIAAGIRMML